jgi:acyl dehydratase
LNVASKTHHSYLDPDGVVAYAYASNDPNRFYLDGDVVPPLYAVTVAWAAFREVIDLPDEAIEGNTGGLHGEHDLRIYKAMTPGSWLHTVGDISSVVCNSAGMNVYARLRSSDEHGELVVEQYWSALFRGAVTGESRGALMDHTLPDEARSSPLGTLRLPTTRDQTFRYAGASGDRSPVHTDDSAAVKFGFPRKYNQGLCTLAIVSRGLIELAADGDPRRIRRIAVRFSSPVFPGDPIDLSLYDTDVEDGESRTYGFDALSSGQVALRRGLVQVLATGEER